MAGLHNRTLLRVDAVLSWDPSLGADEELRLQIYHEYPSGETDVGKPHGVRTGASPLQIEADNLLVPITGTGQLKFVVYFAFRDSPTGSYQMQAEQPFHLEVEVLSREFRPEDLDTLQPPQRERNGM